MIKQQVWFRGNKAACKWTLQEARDVVGDVYRYVKDNPTVCLLPEIEQYVLENHGVSKSNWRKWREITHKDDELMQQVFQLIDNIMESRVVKDQTLFRPKAQELVMHSKYDYAEKSKIDLDSKMNLISELKDKTPEELKAELKRRGIK